MAKLLSTEAQNFTGWDRGAGANPRAASSCPTAARSRIKTLLFPACPHQETMSAKPIETLEVGVDAPVVRLVGVTSGAARSGGSGWKKTTPQDPRSGSYSISAIKVSRPSSYNDAVEEALCFGWIDSLIRRLDDARYARKLTPRKAGSKWSTINRQRYADLESRGLLAAPGLERAPTSRSGDAPGTRVAALPSYIEERLKTSPSAWQHFAELAPSHRRAYIGWIDSAKRDETKDRRLREALNLLAAGKKLGLK